MGFVDEKKISLFILIQKVLDALNVDLMMEDIWEGIWRSAKEWQVQHE